MWTLVNIVNGYVDLANNVRSFELLGLFFSLGVMSGSNGRSSSSCTVTYVGGTASVSCVDTTSSGYQVTLLQDNDPYNLTVVNVRPGEKQTVPVVPSGRYCIMELPMGDSYDSEIICAIEFNAEEDATPSSSTADEINSPVDGNIIISKIWGGGVTSAKSEDR